MEIVEEDRGVKIVKVMVSYLATGTVITLYLINHTRNGLTTIT